MRFLKGDRIKYQGKSGVVVEANNVTPGMIDIKLDGNPYTRRAPVSQLAKANGRRIRRNGNELEGMNNKPLSKTEAAELRKRLKAVTTFNRAQFGAAPEAVRRSVHSLIQFFELNKYEFSVSNDGTISCVENKCPAWISYILNGRSPHFASRIVLSTLRLVDPTTNQEAAVTVRAFTVNELGAVQGLAGTFHNLDPLFKLWVSVGIDPSPLNPLNPKLSNKAHIQLLLSYALIGPAALSTKPETAFEAPTPTAVTPVVEVSPLDAGKSNSYYTLFREGPVAVLVWLIGDEADTNAFKLRGALVAKFEKGKWIIDANDIRTRFKPKPATLKLLHAAMFTALSSFLDTPVYVDEHGVLNVFDGRGKESPRVVLTSTSQVRPELNVVVQSLSPRGFIDALDEIAEVVASKKTAEAETDEQKSSKALSPEELLARRIAGFQAPKAADPTKAKVKLIDFGATISRVSGVAPREVRPEEKEAKNELTRNIRSINRLRAKRGEMRELDLDYFASLASGSATIDQAVAYTLHLESGLSKVYSPLHKLQTAADLPLTDIQASLEAIEAQQARRLPHERVDARIILAEQLTATFEKLKATISLKKREQTARRTDASKMDSARDIAKAIQSPGPGAGVFTRLDPPRLVKGTSEGEHAEICGNTIDGVAYYITVDAEERGSAAYDLKWESPRAEKGAGDESVESLFLYMADTDYHEAFAELVFVLPNLADGEDVVWVPSGSNVQESLWVTLFHQYINPSRSFDEYMDGNTFVQGAGCEANDARIVNYVNELYESGKISNLVPPALMVRGPQYVMAYLQALSDIYAYGPMVKASIRAELVREQGARVAYRVFYRHPMYYRILTNFFKQQIQPLTVRGRDSKAAADKRRYLFNDPNAQIWVREAGPSPYATRTKASKRGQKTVRGEDTVQVRTRTEAKELNPSIVFSYKNMEAVFEELDVADPFGFMLDMALRQGSRLRGLAESRSGMNYAQVKRSSSMERIFDLFKPFGRLQWRVPSDFRHQDDLISALYDLTRKYGPYTPNGISVDVINSYLTSGLFWRKRAYNSTMRFAPSWEPLVLQDSLEPDDRIMLVNIHKADNPYFSWVPRLVTISAREPTCLSRSQERANHYLYDAAIAMSGVDGAFNDLKQAITNKKTFTRKGQAESVTVAAQVEGSISNFFYKTQNYLYLMNQLKMASSGGGILPEIGAMETRTRLESLVPDAIESKGEVWGAGNENFRNIVGTVIDRPYAKLKTDRISGKQYIDGVFNNILTTHVGIPFMGRGNVLSDTVYRLAEFIRYKLDYFKGINYTTHPLLPVYEFMVGMGLPPDVSGIESERWLPVNSYEERQKMAMSGRCYLRSDTMVKWDPDAPLTASECMWLRALAHRMQNIDAETEELYNALGFVIRGLNDSCTYIKYTKTDGQTKELSNPTHIRAFFEDAKEKLYGHLYNFSGDTLRAEGHFEKIGPMLKSYDIEGKASWVAGYELSRALLNAEEVNVIAEYLLFLTGTLWSSLLQADFSDSRQGFEDAKARLVAFVLYVSGRGHEVAGPLTILAGNKFDPKTDSVWRQYRKIILKDVSNSTGGSQLGRGSDRKVMRVFMTYNPVLFQLTKTMWPSRSKKSSGWAGILNNPKLIESVEQMGQFGYLSNTLQECLADLMRIKQNRGDISPPSEKEILEVLVVNKLGVPLGGTEEDENIITDTATYDLANKRNPFVATRDAFTATLAEFAGKYASSLPPNVEARNYFQIGPVQAGIWSTLTTLKIVSDKRFKTAIKAIQNVMIPSEAQARLARASSTAIWGSEESAEGYVVPADREDFIACMLPNMLFGTAGDPVTQQNIASLFIRVALMGSMFIPIVSSNDNVPELQTNVDMLRNAMASLRHWVARSAPKGIFVDRTGLKQSTRLMESPNVEKVISGKLDHVPFTDTAVYAEVASLLGMRFPTDTISGRELQAINSLIRKFRIDPPAVPDARGVLSQLPHIPTTAADEYLLDKPTLISLIRYASVLRAPEQGAVELFKQSFVEAEKKGEGTLPSRSLIMRESSPARKVQREADLRSIDKMLQVLEAELAHVKASS